MFGQVHIRFKLTGAGGTLLALNVNPLGDIAARLDTGPGVLSGLRVRRARADAQAIQPQALWILTKGFRLLLPPTPLIEASAAPTWASCRGVSCCVGAPNSNSAMISSCGFAGELLKSKTGASARPVMCMVAVVSPMVVCAVKSNVGQFCFATRAVEAHAPSVKFKRPVASEKVPRSRSKPPLTSGDAVVRRSADRRASWHPSRGLHQNLVRRLYRNVQSDDERFFRDGFLGAATSNVQYRDVKRQAIGDANQGPIKMHGSRHVEPLARRAFDREVRV